MSSVPIIRTAKSALRGLHRSAVLRMALAQSRRYLAGTGSMPGGLSDRLMYGWGNEGWSAKPPLIDYLLKELRGFRGTILECGSGLSTVLFGIRAAQAGSRFVSLEHDKDWYALLSKRLMLLGLDDSGLLFAKVVSNKDFDWYDEHEVISNTAPFNFVLCDGPPSATRGGRYGLLPRMFSRLAIGALVIVDDSQRADEAQMIKRWLAEYKGKLIVESVHDSFTALRKTG